MNLKFVFKNVAIDKLGYVLWARFNLGSCEFKRCPF